MSVPLIEALEAAQERFPSPIYVVGGTVRDRLLGIECRDWDFVVRGAQPVARWVGKRLRAKVVTLHADRRIYRLILQGTGRPVTADIAELEGGTIEADLAKRDFTINAMAMPLGRDIVLDPFGGQNDLRRKRIRAVSPGALAADPLRLLRAFRLMAQLDFAIEPGTASLLRRAAAQRRAGGIGVAPERVREELLRLFSLPEASPALALMDRLGVLDLLFPEMDACRRCAARFYGRGGVLKHSLATVANLEWLLGRLAGPGLPRVFPDGIRAPLAAYVDGSFGGFSRGAWLRFGALLHDVGKPETAQVLKGRLRFFAHEHKGADKAFVMAERLRCSRAEMLLLQRWVRHHMRLGSLAAASGVTDKALARYFRDLGDDGIGMVLISLGDHYDYLARAKWGKGSDPVERMARRLLEGYVGRRAELIPEKLVNGHQLMRTFKIAPGPLVGDLLKAIEDAQSEGRVKTAEEAWALVKKRLKAAGGRSTAARASAKRFPTRKA